MWHAKKYGGYTRDSSEAQDNANEIATTLYNNGWVKESIASLLGNGAGESGLNPWRWEMVNGVDYVPTKSEFESWTPAQAQGHGYGIFQFTPANKYINSQNELDYSGDGYGPNFDDYVGRPTDGKAQVAFFNDTLPSSWLQSQSNFNYYYLSFQNIGVDITPWYWTTLNNFINGVDNNGNQLGLAELVGIFELVYERPNNQAAADTYYARIGLAQYWLDHINILPTRKSMPWIFYMKRREF